LALKGIVKMHRCTDSLLHSAGITAVMKALQLPVYTDPVDITCKTRLIVAWPSNMTDSHLGSTFGFFAWAS